MSRKNAPLPNQRPFDFAVPLEFLPRALASSNARPSHPTAVCIATGGQDDGHGHPLANANAGRMAGLRNTDREAWFVDNDPDDGAAGPAAAGPAAAGPA